MKAIWKFETYNLDGTPVKNPKHPEVAAAISEGMSSQTVGVGRDGKSSKGRLWLTALLASKGLQFTPPNTDDDVAAMVLAATGGYSYLTFGAAANGKVYLLEIEPRIEAPEVVTVPSVNVESSLPAGYAIPAPAPFMPGGTNAGSVSTVSGQTAAPAMPFS